jgi:predicted amidophosphoribosyltransferase
VSAQFDSPAPAPTACPLCGAQVAADAIRCGECGYHLAGVAGRPAPFSRKALWWSAAGLLAVYLLTLLVVALAR